MYDTNQKNPKKTTNKQQKKNELTRDPKTDKGGATGEQGV